MRTSARQPYALGTRVLVALLMLPSLSPASGGTAAPASAAAHGEAPELRARVEAGTLPTVVQRLPENPLVVKPCEGIGRYGGVWRRAHVGPKDAYGATYLTKETLLLYSPDYSRIVPNVCESYEMSEDCRTFTFHLRKGMSWSDGEPFTADDYLFWYEDVACNKALTPVFPLWLTRDGEPMVMTKVDAHTFTIAFCKPYAALPDYLAGLWNPTLYLPKHYALQFHQDYAPGPELEQAMEEGSFNHWVDMFRQKTYYVANPACPTINAWRVRDLVSVQMQRWERNPYYWKVDAAGNQLPYIDAIHLKLVSNAEAVVLQAAAGEIDMQMRRIGGINVVGIENYPLLMENRERGKFRVMQRDIFRQNKFAILFNYHHRDPRLRRLFNDRRFRIALSHSLDRQELNEFCMQGLGEPSQVMAHPSSRWYDAECAALYLTHDKAKAGRLLDELGLRWNRRHTVRLHPDGSVLMMTMKVPGALVEAMELIREQWWEVGIKLIVTPVESSYWYTMLRAGNYDLTSHGVNTGWEGCFMHAIVIPPYYSNYAAPLWDLWTRTNGEAGEEPPEWFQSMLVLTDRVLALPRGPERVDLIKKIQRVANENLLRVGVLTAPPQATFAVVGDAFRNVPDPIPNLMCCRPAAFFFRQD